MKFGAAILVASTFVFSQQPTAQVITMLSGGHIVKLSWTNPTATPPNTPAAQNTVYRASGVGNCGAYTAIAKIAAIASATYQDSDPNLTSGYTYCYEVDAVDAQGNVSQARSNSTSVSIPKATVCSPTTPCASINIVNSSMSASVVTGGGGSQTSGPGIAILWSCMGGTANCSAANLNTNIQQLASGQPISGYWNYVSFPQTTSSVTYLDQEPAGSLMNYAVANQWNSANAATGAAAGPVSGITIFQVPSAPAATVPTAPAAPTVTPNTSGTPGPQGTNPVAKPQSKPKKPNNPSVTGVQ